MSHDPAVELEDEARAAAHACPLHVLVESPSAPISAGPHQVPRVELRVEGEVDEAWLRALLV
jgi:hypothetical protein